jgi:2-phosphosulfolactate phosphatase
VEISIHGRFPEGTKRERQGSDIRKREMSPLPRKIRVWMKKEEIDGAALAGATAVVMDVCLATTTLLKIVEGGPRRVIPTGSLEEACRLAEELDSPRLLTGGEEGGFRVEGFHCGPYPDEYPPEKVKGKDVIYLTTNGTRAIHRARAADELLIACLRNAPAMARYLQGVETEKVQLICAGSLGRVSLEDALCAAVILAEMDLSDWDLDDGAALLRDWGRRVRADIPHLLKTGRVGRWFEREGEEHVLRYTGEVGASDTLVAFKGGQLVPWPVMEGGGRRAGYAVK